MVMALGNAYAVEAFTTNAALGMSLRTRGWMGPARRRWGAGKPLIHETISTMIDAPACSHTTQPTAAALLMRVESGRPLRVSASTITATDGIPAGQGEA